MVELVVPLAITVLVVQNGQGIAVLRAAGHAPPVNAITAACGVGARSSPAGRRRLDLPHRPGQRDHHRLGRKAPPLHRGHHASACWRSFSGCSPGFHPPAARRAAAFIAALAGLAMLRVLQTAFIVSFRGKFTLGALVTFLVTVADVPIFNIGAPFWGLVFGFAVSWLLEREDFCAPTG